MKTRTVTRTLVLVALMLNLGVAGVYAQQTRKDDVFGNCRGQHDQSKAARHKYRRREFRRERYAGTIHLS